MKRYIMKYSLIAFLLLCTGALWAQGFAEQSVYRGTYATSDEMTFELVNKHGNVQIMNWDKDSIQITTEVFLSASSLKKLNKLKKSVKIKYDATTHHVFAQTTFGSNSVQLMNEFQSFTQNLTPSSSKKIDINYKVYVPNNVRLIIKNQYGDIYLDDIDENIEIEHSNGTLKANTMKGSANMNLRFVEATIHQINDGEVNMYYSTLDIEKAISLTCESSSSELNAGNIGVLKLHSSRDKIRVKEVGYLYGDAAYPKLKVGKLINELDCDFSYGNISVADVDNGATILSIRSERTDIELNVSKSLSHHFEYIYNESCNLQLPYKPERKTSMYKGEVVKKSMGEIGEKPQLDISIIAIKRCDIKMHYHI